MSIVSTALPQAIRPPDDPYWLGWRFVKQIRADGTEAYVQRPLTEADLLYPEEGDHVVTDYVHALHILALVAALRAKLNGIPGVVVLWDHRVSWAVPGVQPLGPDLLVCMDVRQHRQDAGTFDFVESGGRPVVVIEVTSAESRTNDLSVKVDLYQRAGVEWYVVIDRHIGGDAPATLLGYRFDASGRIPLELDATGRLWLEPLQVWLTLKNNRSVVIDGATGEAIPDLTEALHAKDEALHAKDEAEELKAEAERRASVADTKFLKEKQRADDLEAELNRLRGAGPQTLH